MGGQKINIFELMLVLVLESARGVPSSEKGEGRSPEKPILNVPNLSQAISKKSSKKLPRVVHFSIRLTLRTLTELPRRHKTCCL